MRVGAPRAEFLGVLGAVAQQARAVTLLPEFRRPPRGLATRCHCEPLGLYQAGFSHCSGCCWCPEAHRQVQLGSVTWARWWVRGKGCWVGLLASIGLDRNGTPGSTCADKVRYKQALRTSCTCTPFRFLHQLQGGAHMLHSPWSCAPETIHMPEPAPRHG